MKNALSLLGLDENVKRIRRIFLLLRTRVYGFFKSMLRKFVQSLLINPI